MVKVLDIGRVVVKVLGREAGRKAVIVDIID
ncbi:MAG: 50S ribosomal protein L14e, partial [Pyrobaculum sp.]